MADVKMLEEEISQDKRGRKEDKIASAEASVPSINELLSADLLRTAVDPELSEDQALALLKHADLSHEVIEQFSRNSNALRSRKVKVALVSHPNTPRHVSVPLARQFYTFDLMKVALAPRVPADVKIALDDTLISRLKTVTLGERLALARRASGRVAAALLRDAETSTAIVEGKNTKAKSVESRVVHAALENPRLTEALVISTVLRSAANTALIHAVAQHPSWSRRGEIRAALLRTEHLSLARALEFGREIPAPLLKETLASSRLPDKIKNQLLREAKFQDSGGVDAPACVPVVRSP